MAVISPEEVQQSVELTRQWMAADNAAYGHGDCRPHAAHQLPDAERICTFIFYHCGLSL